MNNKIVSVFGYRCLAPFANDRQTSNSCYKHLFQKNGHNLFRRRNEKEI